MKSAVLLRLLSLFLGIAVCIGLLSASVTQEVPRGSLHGFVTMSENGKHLPNAWVTIELVGGGSDESASEDNGEFQPILRHQREYHRFRTDKFGEFKAPNLAAGIYTVTVNSKAHDSKQRSLLVEEGKDLDISDILTVDPKDPDLQLYASQRVFTPGDTPSFEIHGFDPADKAVVHYYKLDLGKIVSKGGLSTLLYSFSRPGNEGGSDPSKSAVSSGQFDKPLVSKDIEGVFVEPIKLPKLDEGFYYVTCDVGDQSKATYLNISTIGLVTKTTKSDALCFVTDLVSGKPIQDAAIEQPGGSGLRTVAKTDRSGLARVTVPNSDLAKALIVATYGKSQAVVDFDNESQGDDDSARMFIYSDRPIYRPGDTVQFKGIVRKLHNLKYSLPPSGTVNIEILDSDETRIQSFSLPLSAKGTFAGSFKSNVEDKPGVYSVNAKYGSTEYTYYVNLAAYRKPEFSIKVTPNKKFYVYGEKASATVKVEYYFGGPVVGAKIDAYVTRRPNYDYGYADEDDSDYDEGGYSEGYYAKEFQGEYDKQVSVVTNAKGEAVIEFDTKTEGDPDIPDYDLDYSVDASVTDASGKYFDGSGDVPVMRGDVSADLETDDYIAEPGTVVNATVTVANEADDKPVANKEVTLQIGTEEWEDTKSTFTLKQTLTGRTDAKGVATIPFTVGSEGSVVLKSIVPDSQGRPVKSVQYLYVEGDRLFGPPAETFTVTLDKRHYKPGERCKVMVQTNKPGGTALITVQAEKVLKTYVVDLTKPSTMTTIPVSGDFTPNVWVSAVAIRNKHLLEAQSRLNVDTTEHELKIDVTSDQPDYLPGETANVTIKTTNADGAPVSADVSLGVVDESIYAIHEDTTNIRRGFYPMRDNEVRTNYSFEDIYLDGGDKAGGNIPVRSKFLDTATWQPDIQTDASGVAHTRVKLPDNLTSWRATVVGVSDATQVGLTHINFRARKPLSVRLELPSFLVQQDTQKIIAIVTNDTGQDREVNVRLDAQGIDVSGQTSQKVMVSAAKPLAITWDVKTPTSGTAKLTAYAWTDQGGFQDAEGRSLTVEPHGRQLIETHSGEIKDTASATFDLSPTADPISGRLLVTISPSIGTMIYQSLDELIDFPYGCTEQTMSRFLPTVVLSSTLKELHVRSDLEAKVPAIVADGFARLAKMQHSNGTWGWWEYDDADDYMTAYVLDGLHRAKEAGFESNRIPTTGAIEWAKKRFKDTKLERYNRSAFLYLCYAVSLYGAHDEVRAALKRVKPQSGADYALIALTEHQLGDQAAVAEALAKLHGKAVTEGDIVRFPSEWYYGATSSAFPLIALTTLTPADPTIGKIVRGLAMDRRGDMWNSTRDSALALIGLTQYMKYTRDMGKPIDIAMTINGGTPRQFHFDPANQFSPTLKVTIPISELRAGPNHMEFRRTGADGICYFGGELKQVELADRLLPVQNNSGLTVTRNYYVLAPQHMEDGSFELRPLRRATDEVKSGDLVRVELIISSTVDRDFIMVEDPIPSGCRITEREYVDDNESWTNWWAQTIVRDDRAAFFIRDLPKGVQKLTYTVRAEQVGLGHALPPSISNMYDPNQSGSGGENLLRVDP
ncbi:MAG TPA: MG2 domain-containing protein [Fimbriimonadaceae bacterium]|nr:MG2 domain-containing protein [Fimbriimonadaceae bacterium]